MEFGVMFFSSLQPEATSGRYRLLLEAAKIADRSDFKSIWTPERHFHAFGGLFPNPAVVGAALAMVTQTLEIRAGSLISPLHDTIRIAENFSVVDNLSDGRAAISFGSGWNAEDFVFFPKNYAERQAVMYRQIEEVRALWRGEVIRRGNSFGRKTNVRLFPQPVRAELPIWVTSSGNVDTFESAGKIGANVLTHLIGQDVGQLAEKIDRYHQARRAAGFDSAGKVSLMLHTFLAADDETARRRVAAPFKKYLRSAVSLEKLAAQSGGAISGGHKIAPHDIPESVIDELLDITFERYYETASLMGTPESCKKLLWDLDEIGVDEVACLIDFVDDAEAVLESLELVGELRRAVAPETFEEAAFASLAAFMEEVEA